jgi:hypothetical protein
MKRIVDNSMRTKEFNDLSSPEQITVLRDTAKALRTDEGDAEHRELWNELADICEDKADRFEAGEDPFAEEEESPEQLRAEADAISAIIELLKRENASTLGELFERHGVVFEEDLN